MNKSLFNCRRLSNVSSRSYLYSISLYLYTVNFFSSVRSVVVSPTFNCFFSLALRLASALFLFHCIHDPLVEFSFSFAFRACQCPILLLCRHRSLFLALAIGRLRPISCSPFSLARPIVFALASAWCNSCSRSNFSSRVHECFIFPFRCVQSPIFFPRFALSA